MNSRLRMNARLLGAVGACAIAIVSLSAQAVPVSGQGTWETTLEPRDFDGNTATIEGYYDTILGITWLADANANGRMTWAAANTWATNLDVNGVTGWRLPTLGPINGTAFDYNGAYDGTTDAGYNMSAPGTVYAGSTANEMAHLYYNTLGNLGYCDPVLSTASSCSGPQSGWGLSNTGLFSNFQSVTQWDIYWSGLEYAPIANSTWLFNFNGGNPVYSLKGNNFFALAVIDGDVGAAVVPVPAAVWLFGSGLIGLLGLVKRK